LRWIAPSPWKSSLMIVDSSCFSRKAGTIAAGCYSFRSAFAMAQKLKRMLLMIVLGALLLLALAIVGVRIAVRSADTGFVDFATLVRPTSPNTALACPVGLCIAKVDLITEPVAVSAQDLAAKVRSLAGTESRTAIVQSDPTGNRFVLIQRSLLFDFPDSVNIAIQPVDAGHATLAIYSRSNYGHGDLGVNRARVERWLDRLGIGWKAG
jgi:uncharacterized protein (DUF1499 family)